MPSRAVLAERVKGEHRLREQAAKFEAERRVEDREDRRIKDEELNGVRLQLREQAATFATRDQLTQLERRIEERFSEAIESLDEEGTEGFREGEAARHARETTADRILTGVNASNERTATNRRWLIGLAVVVMFGVIANGISLAALLIHLATGG